MDQKAIESQVLLKSSKMQIQTEEVLEANKKLLFEANIRKRNQLQHTAIRRNYVWKLHGSRSDYICVQITRRLMKMFIILFDLSKWLN